MKLGLERAKAAVRFGADGIVFSNHGGRQLGGVLSTAKALPDTADTVNFVTFGRNILRTDTAKSSVSFAP